MYKLVEQIKVKIEKIRKKIASILFFFLFIFPDTFLLFTASAVLTVVLFFLFFGIDLNVYVQERRRRKKSKEFI